ncbi:Sulfite exporter TauE/SafE [Anatilimnocola aggregata]|uniref:Probable membrane transporter protein n=1 Tax=Anatilimnocola aggregata TaxID=2528021 RepID=A0A517YLS6_9BACT|nr:sulfite exporter TauE/SafE family protein [Anatilimnocola aggregata]QDU31182.1 Sulfite exporter TauE/SafE [Anatilimnocola aggregata]
MPPYLTVLLILLASSVVQGAVGFAGGLFAIPLLLMMGISAPEAVSINMVASTVQNALGAWRLRREIDFRVAFRPTIIRFITLPLGVATLYWVGNANKDLASQVVGCIILLILAAQWLLSVPPQDQLHWAWEILAFSFGGFLLGLCGMGGPMMVLWVMAHRWPIIKAKAFLYFIFSTGMLPQAFFLWLFFGDEIFGAIGLGLAGIPSLIIGMLIGLKIGSHLPDHVIRRLTIAVLVVIALSSIIVPMLKSKPAAARLSAPYTTHGACHV